MGRTYLFECERCGYRTPVAGGPSEGNDVKVRTIVCRDCRSIYDCVVAVRTEAAARLRCEFGNLPEEVAPSLQTVLGRLPLSSGEGHQWRVFDPVCPVDPTHRVAPWPSPGRCPRCKAYMESAAVPYRHWD